MSDFKLEGRSTQPADTCGACPTPGKPAGPDRLRWFVAHLVPRGDRVVTRPQSSADFPLSFFRRQSGRWCMGGLAWWSAKGNERGDVTWSIEQPRGSRVYVYGGGGACGALNDLIHCHNRLAALLCYPACGSLYYSTLDDGGVTIYILDQGLWSLHCRSATL